MSAPVEFEIQGLGPLLAKLAAVSKSTKIKGGRSALRKAGNVVVKAARENAKQLDDPETGRSIAKNITLRWNNRLFRRTGNLGFRIGVQHGARIVAGADKGKKGPTPHWRFLEFGTERMAAQPFLRRALEQNIAEVTSTFVAEYEKALDKAIATAAAAGAT